MIKKLKQMKKIIFLIVAICSNLGFTQNESPYHTDYVTDGSIIIGAAGLNVLGLYEIKNKDSLSLEKFNNLDQNKIWAIDRWSTGYNNEKASKFSDIPLITSLAVPFLFTLDKRTRQHA